jgi:long-chain acyl-CoA synthetase
MDNDGPAGLRHAEDFSPTRTPHPWEKLYPADGAPWHAPIPTGIVPALLDRAASDWGDKPAIEYRDRQTSFAALAALVDRMAAGLLQEGVSSKSSVALFMPNTPWHTVCFFAVLKTGARVVHLSPLDAPRELAHKMADSGAELLITTDLGGLGAAAARFVDMGLARCVLVGSDAFWGGPEAPPVAYGGAVRRLETVLADTLPDTWPSVRPQDIALLQYTGGTTGMPKGCMLTHANLTGATNIYLTWRDGMFQQPGAQKVIAVLPMFHIYALVVILLLNIVDGNEILLRPRFDVGTTIRDIEEKRATSFPAVPTMLIAILNEPGAAGRDYSSLAMIGSGGAPMPHEVGQRVEALFNQRMRGGWGMTETSAAGTRIPVGTPARPGLIGVPLHGVELRVVSLTDPGKVLGPDQVGELAVRGPNITSGYWNQPALNSECFVDGFFLTGDIGTMDENGLFTIVDRKKRMIISGGFNVYPNMIENAIYEHPDVEETIVIGVPDAYRGEAAKAFIKMKADRPKLTLEDLRIFLQDRVGKHEMPACLELRDSLPRSAVGKLQASVLVDEERARRGATV